MASALRVLALLLLLALLELLSVLSVLPDIPLPAGKLRHGNQLATVSAGKIFWRQGNGQQT